MADIVNAPDLPSDDEEDDDYDPSRDADKGDEPRTRTKSGPKGRNKRPLEDAGEPSDDDNEDPCQGSKYSKEAAKKAKTDALWASLSGGGKSQNGVVREQSATAEAKTAGSRSSTGINWGSLCRPIAKAAVPQDKNRNWMLQLDFSAKKTTGADALGKPIREQAAIMPSDSSINNAPSASTQEPALKSESAAGAQVAVSIQDGSQSIAAAALAAARAAASGTKHGQVSVMETRRFAGKDIQVSKSVTAAEAAAQAEAEAKKRNKAGLDSVLASLQAAKKVNVLDKSRADWSDFKTSDIKVDDELEAYKKSNDKYLDKVDFLKRAELRQYEKERDARLGGDIRSRGRL